MVPILAPGVYRYSRDIGEDLPQKAQKIVTAKGPTPIRRVEVNTSDRVSRAIEVLRRPIFPAVRYERPYAVRVDFILKLNKQLIQNRGSVGPLFPESSHSLRIPYDNVSWSGHGVPSEAHSPHNEPQYEERRSFFQCQTGLKRKDAIAKNYATWFGFHGQAPEPPIFVGCCT